MSASKRSSRKRANASTNLPRAKRNKCTGTKRPQPQPLEEDEELEERLVESSASGEELELSQLPSQALTETALSFVRFVLQHLSVLLSSIVFLIFC